MELADADRFQSITSHGFKAINDIERAKTANTDQSIMHKIDRSS
ncbi:hypothetical protein HMPREF1613_03586 [Escherichia coli 908616]|nr:hypothetical protein HMPREF9552_04328 [Escherichia coli MS 198-1]ESD06370.1 hypothetical protein HMPREF1595_03044 [Escherichia coli 907672]ESD86398.1 hypothetical protein HMPREF1613_03586 [Escherichia coli 908616]KDZ67166.1 hypothetical protein AB44_0608 [Escherichia coli 3-073-06_S1_C2]